LVDLFASLISNRSASSEMLVSSLKISRATRRSRPDPGDRRRVEIRAKEQMVGSEFLNSEPEPLASFFQQQIVYHEINPVKVFVHGPRQHVLQIADLLYVFLHPVFEINSELPLLPEGRVQLGERIHNPPNMRLHIVVHSVPNPQFASTCARFHYRRSLGSVSRTIARFQVRCAGGSTLFPGSLAPVRFCLEPSALTTPLCARLAGTLRPHDPFAYTRRLHCAEAPRRPARPSLPCFPCATDPIPGGLPCFPVVLTP
jgi:hypothetical protein